MQGIRTAFNTIYNKFLNYYNGWFPPDVLYLSDNYLVINKPFDVKVNSDKPTAPYCMVYNKTCTNITLSFPI
jgi:hypothetical protein